MNGTYRPRIVTILMVLLSHSLCALGSQVEPEMSYIIVHVINPEGVEIASIEGIRGGWLGIYDGETLIGNAAYSYETHNQPITISPGNHTIKVEFNGMGKEQNITLEPGASKHVTFTFDRTTCDIQTLLSRSGGGSSCESGDGDASHIRLPDWVIYEDFIMSWADASSIAQYDSYSYSLPYLRTWTL
jgi:hypothetical protein